MSRRAATWLAWTTCALSLMLTGLSIGILVVLNLFDPDIPVFRYWTHLTAIAVAFSTVLPSYSREVLGAGPDIATLRTAAQRALDSCRAALGVAK